MLFGRAAGSRPQPVRHADPSRQQAASSQQQLL